ncbi:hypothetical protein Pa4123_83110 [Phytohabitans aurantiacus]|uniref:Uncharacterized protein n=2 Tax=Phytohabitans aurantiacus TaxID=3016789 RepID=A0ABQ5R9Z2_9ACTN|nr:hypothetical protein Pa4123_83110 [Phytohabitans aurantiacus]
MFAGLAAAGVLAVGIAAPTVAFAEDGSGSSSTSQTDRKQARADRDAAFAKALAAELGISEDKVAAAVEKVREQQKPQGQPKGAPKTQADRQAELKSRLDAAVKEGKLTQEQADAILKAYEAGVLGGFAGKGAPGPK